jgi:hypothetical protein
MKIFKTIKCNNKILIHLSKDIALITKSKQCMSCVPIYNPKLVIKPGVSYLIAAKGIPSSHSATTSISPTLLTLVLSNLL